MMKKVRTPAMIFVVLCLGFIMFLVWSAQLLPERVATHFGMHGLPNGWMSRSWHLWFTGAFGIGISLFIVVLGWFNKFIPQNGINIPNRQYWLSPQRRSQTCNDIFCLMLWLACMMIVFFAGIEFVIIKANQTSPVHLPIGFYILVSGFLVLVLVWSLIMIRHFSKIE
jgi:uncharacterized membrane protein